MSKFTLYFSIHNFIRTLKLVHITLFRKTKDLLSKDDLSPPVVMQPSLSRFDLQEIPEKDQYSTGLDIKDQVSK